MTPHPCPKCGPKGRVEVWDCGLGVSVSCVECFDADCAGDPPEYVSRSLQGTGGTEAQAVAAWNERVEEFIADRDFDEGVQP